MDAWETLIANATDTTDAWSALNSQEGGGATPGEPIKELSFTLSQQIISGSVLIPVLSGIIAEYSIDGNISATALSGSVSKADLSGIIDVEEI